MKFKNIISAAFLLSGLILSVSSCKEDSLPEYMHADNREVKLENTGFSSNGDMAMVVLAANDEWHVTRKDEWLHISHESGTRGRHNLFISADENTSSKSRLGFIEIAMGGKNEQFAVTQSGTVYTIESDAEEIGFKIDGHPLGSEKAIVKMSFSHSWKIVIPEDASWLKANPESGDSGEFEVEFTAEANATDSKRETVVDLCTGDIVKHIAVKQAGPLAFDDKPAGYVYFNDDMSWASGVGGQDQVGSPGGTASTTRNIYTFADAVSKCLPQFQERYEDLNRSAQTVYVADGYLKFGAGSKQTAFRLKESLSISADCKSNVEVTFRGAKNGTDKMTFSVAIEGPGEIVDAFDESKTISKDLVPVNNDDKSINWQWKEFSVKIKDVTPETKIVIGESQFIKDGYKARSGYFRAFIDDIKVTRIANN